MGKNTWKSKYDKVRPFKEDVAVVVLNNMCGLVDREGNEIIPPKYDKLKPFHDGYAFVELYEKKGIIDKTGKEVVACMYDYVCGYSNDNLFAVGLYGKCGFIDGEGNEIIPFIYDYANNFIDDLAMVCVGRTNIMDSYSNGKYDLEKIDMDSYSNGKYGFINKTGDIVVPCIYDYVAPFKEGLSRVILKKNGYSKFGFINKTGKVVIPIKYDSASDFEDGTAKVDKNCDVFLIDKKGNIVKELSEGMKIDFDGIEYNMSFTLYQQFLDLSRQSIENNKQLMFTYDNDDEYKIVDVYLAEKEIEEDIIEYETEIEEINIEKPKESFFSKIKNLLK